MCVLSFILAVLQSDFCSPIQSDFYISSCSAYLAHVKSTGVVNSISSPQSRLKLSLQDAVDRFPSSSPEISLFNSCLSIQRVQDARTFKRALISGHMLPYIMVDVGRPLRAAYSVQPDASVSQLSLRLWERTSRVLGCFSREASS